MKSSISNGFRMYCCATTDSIGLIFSRSCVRKIPRPWQPASGLTMKMLFLYDLPLPETAAGGFDGEGGEGESRSSGGQQVVCARGWSTCHTRSRSRNSSRNLRRAQRQPTLDELTVELRPKVLVIRGQHPGPRVKRVLFREVLPHLLKVLRQPRLSGGSRGV